MCDTADDCLASAGYTCELDNEGAATCSEHDGESFELLNTPCDNSSSGAGLCDGSGAVCSGK